MNAIEVVTDVVERGKQSENWRLGARRGVWLPGKREEREGRGKGEGRES